VIEPHYPKTDDKQGRPVMGLSRMLRIYILQQVMGFSDESTEDTVYDSPVIQLFLGIDLGRDPADFCRGQFPTSNQRLAPQKEHGH